MSDIKGAREVYSVLAADWGWDEDSFDDHFRGGPFRDATEFGEEYVADVGWGEIPRRYVVEYFDYERLGRDLMQSYHLGNEDDGEDSDHYYDEDGEDMGEFRSHLQVGLDRFTDLFGDLDPDSDEPIPDDLLSRESKRVLRDYFDYGDWVEDLRGTDFLEKDGYWFMV